MGNKVKPPPIVQEEPRPDIAGVDGVSISSAQGCQRCVLSVPQGVSSSSATMYRDQGTITLEECSRGNADAQKVRTNTMSLDEFKENARKLLYYENMNNGYCAQLSFSEEVLAKARTIDEVGIPGTVQKPAFRKITSDGGF